MLKKLVMPPSSSDPSLFEVESSGPIAVIGANGSGKTKLGWWIEEQDSEGVHRIAAQKSLAFPEAVRPWALEEARKAFTYGTSHPDPDYLRRQGKRTGRWGNRPTTNLLNDVEALMTLLHTEEYEDLLAAKRSREAPTSEEGDIGGGEAAQETPAEETKLDALTRMWEDLFPHRKLAVRAGTVETFPSDAPDALYNAAEMSDGERVAFYMMGECLCAPEDVTLVIDEPEMHLHKSLLSRLWDLIEDERDDCLFVYLTHDLDFATSRKSATVVCLRDFDGSSWDWFLAPEVEDIPEALLLRILGSRKPVLFVEGERGCLDEQVYELAFPEWYVVPLGSCSKVADAVRAFRSLHSLHKLKVRGVVDRDRRSLAQIAAYEGDGIHALEVANVENLLVTEDVLEEASRLLQRTDTERLVERAKKLVREEFRRRLPGLLASAVRQRAADHLQFPAIEGCDPDELKAAYVEHVASFDVSSEYASLSEEYESLLSSSDHSGILRVFCGKGLPKLVSALFEMKPAGYTGHVLRMMKADAGAMRECIRVHLPELG